MKESTLRAGNPFDTTEKRIAVVQCPSCQTKFAVDAHTVASLDAPRFHCSRCDHVFSLDRKALGLDQIEPTPQRRVAPSPLPEEEVAPPSWNAPMASRALEVPKATGIVRTSAPHENINAEEQLPFDFTAPPQVPEPKIEFDFSSPAFDALDDESMKNAFSTPEFKAIEEEATGYASMSRGFDAKALEAWSDSVVARDLFDSSESKTLSVQSSSRWRDTFQLTSPILGFMLVLIAITAISIGTPTQANKWISSFFPSLESAPPADLVITNTSLKRVTLESGDTMQVISGKLINNSSATYREVQVEALLFDSSGKVVVRKKINAASSLGRTRLQSLTPEMIDNLQTTQSAKRFQLKEGQSQEFTLAVPEDVQHTPRFYSARVYSVKSL